MKSVIYNRNQLDVVVRDIYSKFDEFGSLQLDYQKPYKDKTLKQLGFFFGGLVDSVIDYYESIGERWSVDDVKENFYQACSYLDESLKKKVKRFNGQEYEVPLRLSEMDIEQASLFIDKCVYLIDNARCFDGLVLRPELRYTWVRNIKKDDLDQLRYIKLAREDKAYLEHTRKQCCIWCGKQHQTEVHHLKVAGYTGTGYKADDWLCIPLCHDCHINTLHQQGVEQFEKDLSWITKHMSLVDFCKIRYNKWRNKI